MPFSFTVLSKVKGFSKSFSYVVSITITSDNLLNSFMRKTGSVRLYIYVTKLSTLFFHIL